MYKLFKHDIIQLQIKPFYIQLPDSLPLNFIAEKSKREKAFHMSSVAFENMLIWTKYLE